MPQAWNSWYHCTIHAYGSWLRGDPRGWRTRGHREHVEGDYKNPPSQEAYGRVYARSLKLMKREPVQIENDLREIVLKAIVEKLRRDKIEVLAACLDGTHVHLLGRFSDHNPKHWIGRAKKHASHVVRQENLRTDTGGLWGRYSYAKPIENRPHQLKVFRYILAHADRGAIVWRFDRQGAINKKPADGHPRALPVRDNVET